MNEYDVAAEDCVDQDRHAFLYFAYGANLNRRGMGERCPAAVPYGPYRLDGFRLVFRRVADIEPAPGEAVHGVLWWITPACRDMLDLFEGFPSLYGRQPFDTEDQSRAFFYQMNAGGYDLPSSGYYQTIRQGYADFGLPEDRLLAAYTFTEAHEEPVWD